jgi:Tfp pilus assembly ATPase PilU
VAGRIRVTFYRRNGITELSCRFCGKLFPTREELGLPTRVDELARKTNGLILITGPTGAGKSTTMNYMIDLINGERRCKILTIEDPIERVHENRRAIVVQQEVLTDVRSFNHALIHALRQDPDVICIGEMREHETIQTALIGCGGRGTGAAADALATQIEDLFAHDAAGWHQWQSQIARLAKPDAALRIADFILSGEGGGNGEWRVMGG